MAVTLYRQVGKGRLAATRRSILGAGADRPISPVPTSYGIRWLTVPVPGKPLATTSMRQSRRRSASSAVGFCAFLPPFPCLNCAFPIKFPDAPK